MKTLVLLTLPQGASSIWQLAHGRDPYYGNH